LDQELVLLLDIQLARQWAKAMEAAWVSRWLVLETEVKWEFRMETAMDQMLGQETEHKLGPQLASCLVVTLAQSSAVRWGRELAASKEQMWVCSLGRGMGEK
jgi:NRPS condensation-like uncharacterized protein